MDSAPDATPVPGAGSGAGSGAGPAEGGAPAPPALDLQLQSYDMTGKKYMVIFNHFQYQQTSNFSEEMTPRYGTAFDVAALTRTFEAAGFGVAAHDDCTHDQILEIISEFSTRNHSDTACVCVAVLTHGDRSGRVAAADRFYELRDLVSPLQRAAGAAGLAGRPKLVLAQACRGARRDPGVELDGAHAARIGSHADTLVFYSTVQDFVSWRACDGSWAVQQLCRVLARAPALDLLRAATLVTSIVTREHVSSSLSEEDNNKKQTPETCSTLTKLLYLARPAPPAPPATPAAD